MGTRWRGGRTWYAEHGDYTYLEEPGARAAVFPAEELIYRAMIQALFLRRQEPIAVARAAQRYSEGAPKVRALVEAWQAGMPSELQITTGENR